MHYPELAFFFGYLDLPKGRPSGYVCEMWYGFARDSVIDSSAVDVYGSSRLYFRIGHVFVGYAHYGESPCPCLVPWTTSVCVHSCACDLEDVRYLVSVTANDVFVYSACAPARPRPCRRPFSNHYPRFLNAAATVPYLLPSLDPTRQSHNRPVSCAASTALRRRPLLHVLFFLSSPVPLAPFLSLELPVPVHAVWSCYGHRCSE